MELYQLKTFCMIAETGNLTRASKRLYTTQPAVSMQLAKLEEEWGVRLFERSHSGMKLTREGEELHVRAKALLGQSREVEELAGQLRSDAKGLLRIAIVNGGSGLKVPEILEHLNEQNASILPSVSYGYSQSIQEELLIGALDIGIVEGLLDDALLGGFQITETPLGIAVPAKWRDPLATSENWKNFEKYPWVFNSETCTYTQVMDQLRQEHDLKLERKFLMDIGDASMDFVNRGMAISLIDRRMLTDGMDSFLWPFYEYAMPVRVVYPRGKEDHPLVRQFCHSARHVFGMT